MGMNTSWTDAVMRDIGFAHALGGHVELCNPFGI
jgi:hypothetical protein